MREYLSPSEICNSLSGRVAFEGPRLKIENPLWVRAQAVDEWLFNALFNPHPKCVEICRYLIRQSAQALGIFPSSLDSVYRAMAEGRLQGFTVPAINLRGLTYEIAQTLMRAARGREAFPLIFEIARSEIGYTLQSPAEYASSILAAAIKQDYRGPLYIQGDHFQVSPKAYAKDPEKELSAIRHLIDEALEYGFFNIDIDTSTLVDLSHATLREQQSLNYELCAQLTHYIRQRQPEGVEVSVGGEIGEVGAKNSTLEELDAFMEGYRYHLQTLGPSLRGISKISVQTGTSHGGVPLPDGSIAEVKLDFETLQQLSRVARKKYGLSGAVQHGASTLPEACFDRFPQAEASEIHLATGFQNLVYDHPAFPASLRNQIYAWLDRHCADEKKAGQTDEQFYYKTRKKGLGPFKRQLWDLSDDIKQALMGTLQAKFEFLFDKLGISGRRAEVLAYAQTARVDLPFPEILNEARQKTG